jgi:hypothetical protein
MQSIAESPLTVEVLSAAVFFLVKGRNDGNKTIETLSYQFAAKSARCRHLSGMKLNMIQLSMGRRCRLSLLDSSLNHSSTGPCWVFVVS